MTKYTETGLVTDEPSIAVLFYGKDGITYTTNEMERYHAKEWSELIVRLAGPYGIEDGVKIRIPWTLVAEKLKPVEGEPVLWWHESDDATQFQSGEVNMPYICKNLMFSHRTKHIAANALTIGKSVGELRELLKWCGEEK